MAAKRAPPLGLSQRLPFRLRNPRPCERLQQLGLVFLQTEAVFVPGWPQPETATRLDMPIPRTDCLP